jgi:cbb3-type cytochrome oxidase subunit 3
MDVMNLIMWLQHNSILLVFAVFTLILLTTYWPGRRTTIEQHGRIPLDDDR